MTITAFEPNAKCFLPVSKSPQALRCETLLNRMPVSFGERVFGKTGGPDVEIALPVKFETREHEFHIILTKHFNEG